MLANSNMTSSVDTMERSPTNVPNSNVNVAQPFGSLPNLNPPPGPIAILWDIENCRVPSDVRPEDVAGNIRMALLGHPVIQGAVILFSAYGDFNAFPRKVREGCHRTGVKLVDVPNGRKDAADKAILVDMFVFALDNPPPSSIMLISGDVDFAPSLHILGQRGYTVMLVIPSGVGVSPALSNASKFVWDWPSMARGEGSVPPTRSLMCPPGGPIDNAGYSNSAGMPVFASSLRSNSLPSGLNEVLKESVSVIGQNDSNQWGYQSADVNGLKADLVNLLEMSGGRLPFNRVSAEYRRAFGRCLHISEYGAIKLVNLLKKMSDVISVDGKGEKKFVSLQNVSPSALSLPPEMDILTEVVETYPCSSDDEKA